METLTTNDDDDENLFEFFFAPPQTHLNFNSHVTYRHQNCTRLCGGGGSQIDFEYFSKKCEITYWS